MKKTILNTTSILIIALTSLNANAWYDGDRDAKNCVTTPSLCWLSTTTSFPTALIMDSEVNFNSEEAQARILAEANDNFEIQNRILLPKIAEELKTSEQKVKEAILELDNKEQEINLTNISLIVNK